ncbi:MAG TPA: copper amine oxidase N-terminal domain-containing protein [Bacillota bacterium]|nr:copper amine oxidase N-terminal domain-containing protein [Bacillota bacterium]
MRKVKVLILALMLLLVAAIPAAMADQVNVYENQKLVKSVVFKIGVPYYVVNGQTPGERMDVAPFIQKDRTFVPVRFLGNALGVDDSNISWDNTAQTATLKGAKATLSMTIGKPEVISNGQVRAIDVAPMLVDPGRTMLPARFVAEGLGYQVDWDEASQTVICWPAGEPEPDVSAVVQYLNSQAGQVETFTTRAGYQIPKVTKLTIPKDIKELGSGDPNRCELDFGIDLTKGDLESQWADAAYILGQKLDSQTVDEVMAYVKQKTDRWDGLAFKTWESNGKKVGVSSMGGSLGVQITVWYK